MLLYFIQIHKMYNTIVLTYEPWICVISFYHLGSHTVLKICILLADVNKRENDTCMAIGQMEIICPFLFIFLLTQNTVKIQL